MEVHESPHQTATKKAGPIPQLEIQNGKSCAIGIDLSKTTFHLIGLSPRGEIVLRKKLSRKQLLTFTATRMPLLIGMEACTGAHYLARALRDQGHDARLMPAQYVKPYV